MKGFSRLMYLLIPALFAVAMLRFPPWDEDDRSSDSALGVSVNHILNR